MTPHNNYILRTTANARMTRLYVIVEESTAEEAVKWSHPVPAEMLELGYSILAASWPGSLQ